MPRTLTPHWDFFRLGAEENNIVTTWKAMGEPAYPTTAQLAELRAHNILQAAKGGSLVLEGNYAVFEIECPGVACLEWSERD